MRLILAACVALSIPTMGCAQAVAPMGVLEKLNYHLDRSAGPVALVGDAAYAALLQAADTPAEWKQGAAGYGKRFASTAAASGIHSAIAFGLDSTLREDPRYFRSGEGRILRRAVHALRGVILTHTDRGTETFSVWRFGSAYGAAYLSNQWYPGRLNTLGLGFSEGSVQLAFDLASNLASEFWPDLKRKVLRR